MRDMLSVPDTPVCLQSIGIPESTGRTIKTMNAILATDIPIGQMA